MLSSLELFSTYAGNAYAWMRVPERPAMASAAFSSEPMMQTRPGRDSAN